MFKDKLIELRRQKGMTQQDVANLLHCSKGAVGKYERGEAEPNIDSLITLSKFFHVSIDYLLDNAVAEQSISQVKANLQSLDRKELINLMEKQIDLLTIIEKKNQK